MEQRWVVRGVRCVAYYRVNVSLDAYFTPRRSAITHRPAPSTLVRWSLARATSLTDSSSIVLTITHHSGCRPRDGWTDGQVDGSMHRPSHRVKRTPALYLYSKHTPVRCVVCQTRLQEQAASSEQGAGSREQRAQSHKE